MPTIDELNQAAPDTPVFVLHLYAQALLNRAALRAVGYTKDTPSPPFGEIVRDASGNLTGLLIARPSAMILYATLAKGPKLSPEYQANSSRHFMRELNRLGITSVIDAGGGFQNYPEDYQVIEQLHRNGELTVRIAYNLFTQKPKGELTDFTNWTGQLKPRQGDDYLRHNGAGETLVYAAADFEDFLEPRPDCPGTMEAELAPIVTLLAKNRWPFRLHATYDETITRALDVYERVNREVPFAGLHWFIDHAETISARNIERIQRLLGVPVGAGTDATRVASYNPFVSLYWLVAGKTVGGLSMYPENNRLDRMEALRLWTVGSSWFSTEENIKGALVPGQFADLAVLSADYFAVQDEEIKRLESVLTIVGGKAVYAAEEFANLAPPLPPVLPEWSPVAHYGGYAKPVIVPAAVHLRNGHARSHMHFSADHGNGGGLGCLCWAF